MAGASDADVVLAFCTQFACVDETSPVVASLRERADAILPLDTNVSGGSKTWRDRVVAFRAAVRQLPSVERGLQCTALLILEDMEKVFLGKTLSSWRRHMGLIAVLLGASFHKLAVNWELTKKLPREHMHHLRCMCDHFTPLVAQAGGPWTGKKNAAGACAAAPAAESPAEPAAEPAAAPAAESADAAFGASAESVPPPNPPSPPGGGPSVDPRGAPPSPPSPPSPDLDPFDVLGVSVFAPIHEVRAAYRRRLLQSHPDKGGSAKRFRAVQRAWEHVNASSSASSGSSGSSGETSPAAWSSSSADAASSDGTSAAPAASAGSAADAAPAAAPVNIAADAAPTATIDVTPPRRPSAKRAGCTPPRRGKALSPDSLDQLLRWMCEEVDRDAEVIVLD